MEIIWRVLIGASFGYAATKNAMAEEWYTMLWVIIAAGWWGLYLWTSNELKNVYASRT